MGQHFYLEDETKHQKVNKIVRVPSDRPSYCGKEPAVRFEAAQQHGWCDECMSIFEKGALDSIAKVIGAMSKGSE